MPIDKGSEEDYSKYELGELLLRLAAGHNNVPATKPSKPDPVSTGVGKRLLKIITEEYI